MIFSPNCLHGNVVNFERKTRWSINIRYKNLLVPTMISTMKKKFLHFISLSHLKELHCLI